MKLGYREGDAPSIEETFAMSDDQLFSKINSNSLHIYNNLCLIVQV